MIDVEPLWPSKLHTAQMSLASNDSQPLGWIVEMTVSPVEPSGSAVVGGYTAVTAPVRPDGPVVPLHKPRAYLFGRYRYDTTVGFLCRLLHTRPDIRQGLGVPARCERLRADILRNPLGPVVDRLGVSSRSIEIHHAVRATGMTHRLGGRPVPGDSLPEEDVAIETVLGWLSHSHSEQAKTVPEEEVREVLRSDYYSIAPWPFAALTT